MLSGGEPHFEVETVGEGVVRKVKGEGHWGVRVFLEVGLEAVVVAGWQLDNGNVHQVGLLVVQGVVEVLPHQPHVPSRVGYVLGLHRLQTPAVVS